MGGEWQAETRQAGKCSVLSRSFPPFQKSAEGNASLASHLLTYSPITAWLTGSRLPPFSEMNYAGIGVASYGQRLGKSAERPPKASTENGCTFSLVPLDKRRKTQE